MSKNFKFESQLNADGGKALTLKHEGKPFELAPGSPVVQKSSVSGEFPR